MKKLIEQLVKFGLVGVVAFVIDEAIMNLLIFIHTNNVVASTVSFLISLVFNYWASMKYVFKHRQDMARWMEALIFLVSAIVGLGINEWIIWMSTLGMPADAVTTQHGVYILRSNIGKLVATVVVAIWNFIIRKWLLDNRSASGSSASETSDVENMAVSGSAAGSDGSVIPTSVRKTFAQKLGEWSIAHTPEGWQ
ncbi:putative flippase GtrA [Bifidobacterium commune]|uniref:Putative flippase GtrA (Transmembrane translocase of bactoprenol-linked glucose) n=1 Tax=Bifidobacterium commune TaxID=1505727 RepID=A0A1C4H7A5_9BIFI|nr:GtrA family protein [Bifidobacterium commune]MBB2955424.1 putative flippase GtrA [Bifidobacterium commune]SCC80580.1 Putative flippase GtrA (transmembrane translocase of bactoprenol-linked glucose) [Bifidobacterium commune]